MRELYDCEGLYKFQQKSIKLTKLGEVENFEANEQPPVYVEMDVLSGYAAHFRYLHTSDVGAYS
jgi:hypothetical protein